MADDGGFARIDGTGGFARVAAPADTGGFERVQAPAPKTGPSALDQLFGRNGAERFQWWPERMVRGAMEAPQAAMRGELGTPGTREFSQRAIEPALDMSAFAIPGGPPRAAGGVRPAPKPLEGEVIPPAPRAPMPEAAPAEPSVVEHAAAAEAPKQLPAPEPTPTAPPRIGQGTAPQVAGQGMPDFGYEGQAQRVTTPQDMRGPWGQEAPKLPPEQGPQAPPRTADAARAAIQEALRGVPGQEPTSGVPLRSLPTGPAPTFDEAMKAIAEALGPLPERGGAGGAAPPGAPPPTGAAPVPPTPKQPGMLARAGGIVEKIFSPETVDANAGKAVELIRAATGRGARDTAITETALEPFHKAVNRLPPEQQMDFIHYVETQGQPHGHNGPPQIDPQLRPIADALKTAFEQRRDKIEALPEHDQMSFVDDYMPHFWKNPEAATTLHNMMGSGKQGSGASLKARTIPTYREGIEAGLTPLTTNPIEMALRYVNSMDQFIASQQVRGAAKDAGLIKYVRPKVMGASGNPDSIKIPEGWTKLEGRGATDATGAQAFAPDGFARVYNNFISRGATGEFGTAMEAARRTTNAVTALELGFSGYHVLTMAQEAAINATANALSSLRAGKPVSAVKHIAETPFAPISYAYKGGKLGKVYKGKATGTPEQQKLVDLLAEAGGRGKGSRHSVDYDFSSQGSYVTAIRRGALKAQLIGDAKDAMGAPFSAPLVLGARHIGRMMDMVAQPIFEKYIPALKTGAFSENMGAWLEQNPGATHAQSVRAARQIVDSIDNRFGEMVQDNVFWNRALKQIAMLALRSWSWTVGGNIRELGGAARDFARAPLKHVDKSVTPAQRPRVEQRVQMQEQQAASMERAAKDTHHPQATREHYAAQASSLRESNQQLNSQLNANIGPNDKRWTQKMDYAIALPIVYGAGAAVYQFLKTGEAPQDVRDLLAPRTGGTDADSGEPERLQMPGMMKDVFGFAEHPLQEMKNKLATAPVKAWEVAWNSDWHNLPIRSPRDKDLGMAEQAPKWLQDYWKYATESFGPISIKQLAKGQKIGSNLNQLETVLGVKTAPRQLIDPEGLDKIKESVAKHEWNRKLNAEKRDKQRYGGTE